MDKKLSKQAQRKNEHYSLAIKFWRNRIKNNNWPQSIFSSSNQPELTEFVNDKITPKLSTYIFDHQFEWPFYIEAMTGGTEVTGRVNGQLATIAKNTHVAMAVGSQSIALKDSNVSDTFRIARKNNPNGFIFANIGADHDLQDTKKVVEMLEANALQIHINVIQETVMDDGDDDFSHWFNNIAEIINGVSVPVIIKGVGFGMGTKTIERIVKLAPAAVNLSGNSGTNFAWIEAQRNRNDKWSELISRDGQSSILPSFSTEESLNYAKKILQDTQKYLSNGGFSNPLDILIAKNRFKADLVGVAGYFLYQNSLGKLEQTIENWQEIMPKINQIYDFS